MIPDADSFDDEFLSNDEVDPNDETVISPTKVRHETTSIPTMIPQSKVDKAREKLLTLQNQFESNQSKRAEVYFKCFHSDEFAINTIMN